MQFDTATGKLYDRLWLWSELGELCKVLAWPCSGAFALYVVWILGTQDPQAVPKIIAAAAACGAAQALFYAGTRLSRSMAGRTVREIDKILFGRDDT